jgi:hypothetical protein
MPKDYLTAQELSAHLATLGIDRTAHRIAVDCAEGKIPGAEKHGIWFIPLSAVKDYLEIAGRGQGRPRKVQLDESPR